MGRPAPVPHSRGASTDRMAGHRPTGDPRGGRSRAAHRRCARERPVARSRRGRRGTEDRLEGGRSRRGALLHHAERAGSAHGRGGGEGPARHGGRPSRDALDRALGARRPHLGDAPRLRVRQRRGRPLQRRCARLGRAAAGGPRRLGDPAAPGPAGAQRRRRRRPGDRHVRPGLARGPRERRDRHGGDAGAAALCRAVRSGRLRAAGHRDRPRRRDRRRRRARDGQARPLPSGDRPRGRAAGARGDRADLCPAEGEGPLPLGTYPCALHGEEEMKVRAALAQVAWTGDKDSMIAKHVQFIEEAAKGGAKVMCLQELFYGPYFCQVQDTKHYSYTERIPDGPTTKLMQELARKHGMVLVVPMYEEEGAGVYYNTAAVIDAGGKYLGKYRKTHIPQVNGFWEKFYFKPGFSDWPVFNTAYLKLGVYICYDRHFPEGWRALALHGAEYVVNPSATVAGLSQYLWKLEQPASAVANGYYVGAINRPGTEAPWNIGKFYGSSYIVTPRGEFLVTASEDQDELVVADMDMDVVRQVRDKWQFFRDRRPDTYGVLATIEK